MIVRRADWPRRMNAFIRERRFKPFEWWIQDCVTLALRNAQAMTDVDFLADVPPYRTAEEAGRVLKARSLEDRVNDGLPQIDRSEMMRGDIALLNLERRSTLAIYTEAGLLGPGLNGLVAVPYDQALIAWGVGHGAQKT